MRYLSILLLLGVTLKVNAQQINPVPDYIFRNQMSVGRNAPTDTAAYMSIGPRYGAVKGFMPPMVVDTNAVTGTKRNGLLIFSVQLNNFAYWDSTTSRFRQITAQATVDSLVFATRAWRKKGDDSLGAVIATRTDTALLSTKAYRQKAVDSLVTLISTLGGGTVLSVGSGYGTNFSTITTTGSVVVDSLVITSRASRDKLKDSLNANIALKVNISDTSTMLGAYLRKADTTAMLTPYLRKGDTTAMLSPYVRSAGYGLLKGTQTLSVDSALMATRARVQKGIDSVASLVAAPDSLLFSTRAWRQKGDDSLGAIIGTKATATGTTNYLSKFTGTSSLGNSIVYATTSEVGISTPSPTHPLDVNGRVRVRTIDSTATGMNMLYADVDGVIKKTAVPAGGTVTSVAAGTGMSFSTITTTGSVSADTVALATRAWRQKGIDSVNANVALKVNISDTSTMLSPYVRAAGFGLTKSGQSLLVDSATIATRARVQKGIDSVAGLSRVTGSGTIGAAAFFTGSTSISASTQFFWDNTNSRLGIGITTPREKIEVVGNITTDWEGRFIGTQFQTGSDYKLGILTNPPQRETRIVAQSADATGNYISFATGTAPSERMRVTRDGDVLIGTTTSTAGGYRLQVAGSIYNTTGAVFAASSGNVGIGTTTPKQRLDVSGAGGKIAITNTDTLNYAELIFYEGSTVKTSQFVNASKQGAFGGANSWNFYQASNAPITFYTNGINERMRITGDGELLIGTTTDAGAHALQVAGSIYNTTGAVLAATSGSVGIGTTSPSAKLENYTSVGTKPTLGDISENYAIVSGDNRTGTATVSGNFATTLVLASNTNSFSAGNGASIGFHSKWNSGLYTSSAQFASVFGGKENSTDANLAGYFSIATRPAGGNPTERMRVSSTGDVGIGTTSPTYRLHLPGQTNTANQAMIAGVVFGSDGNGQTIKPSGSLALTIFGQNDQSYLYGASIGGEGRWGVGTVSPSERLHVNGKVRIATIDSSAGPINMLWADVNGVIRKAAVPAGGGGSADSAVFATRARVQKAVDSINNVNASGTGIANYITRWTGTKTMDTSQIIQVNGNIGIGTSSPGSNKLSVTGATLLNGNIITNATGGFGVYHQQVINETGMVIVSQRDPLGADTVVGAIGFGSNTHQAPARINAISAQAWNSNDRGVYLSFRITPNSTTQNYEMMRIQQDGEVVIGQNYADQGTYRLQVDGNTFTNGSIKTSAPAGGTSGQWKLGTRVASSVALDATQYIEVDIGGTLYYLATVSFLEPKPKPNP